MFIELLISRIGPVRHPLRHTLCKHGSGPFSSYRFWNTVVRIVRRKSFGASHAGNSLTPGGCLLIALTVAAIAITAALSASAVGQELERAVRLSWWFA